MAADDKKERVIHTRVPESLEAELRDRAQSLGISVSNLVRNVLGHAFGLVGDVVADSHAIARAARGKDGAAGAAGASPDGADEVLGFQPFTLSKNAICARCNEILPRGAEAAASVGGRAPSVICTSCFRKEHP
ncbi:MAG TPA: hypothetical protein VGM88_05950 [Kofleriaceae bacterium]|jgi:hypothetical protein